MSFLKNLFNAKKEGKSDDDALLEYCASLETQVNSQEATISKLTIEASNYQSNIDKLQAEIESLKASNLAEKEKMQASLTEATNNAETLTQELSELRAENEKLLSANSNLAQATGKPTMVVTEKVETKKEATTREEKAVEAHLKAIDLVKSGIFN